MYKFVDKFDVASPLLWLQPGPKTCQFCEFSFTSKEVRKNISVSAMETLKKIDGIVEKWSNVKPVSSQAKNYEPFWDKIKNVDTESEDYEGVMWPVRATCHSNFHNKKKLETNSKQKINEIMSKIAKILILIMMTGQIQKNQCQFWGEPVEQA